MSPDFRRRELLDMGICLVFLAALLVMLLVFGGSWHW